MESKRKSSRFVALIIVMLSINLISFGIFLLQNQGHKRKVFDN